MPYPLGPRKVRKPAPSRPAPARIHLLRGAPAVRAWSIHQHTDSNWTLCGLERYENLPDELRMARQATEDTLLVDCPHCLTLMRPGPRQGPKIATLRQAVDSIGVAHPMSQGGNTL